MKAVILAGGLGTRISEETETKPKPMVKIGDMPIIWHIMKIYSAYGINDFVICCGYKSEVLKKFFLELLLEEFDSNIIKKEVIEIKAEIAEPWNVTLVDTGLNSMTGGRLKRIQNFVGNETFCFTYGDTLNDVNIKDLENSVSNKIGLNVSIQNKKNNKGKISFEYKTLDQLNKIIEIIKANY